ncbi:MAG: Lsr2 family DNA-binding protein, partial [Sciscionella sp.]
IMAHRYSSDGPAIRDRRPGRTPARSGHHRGPLLPDLQLDRVRPATIADGLAELQVRWPTIPIVFAETRPLAEEWTYRYLAAAHTWAHTEQAMTLRLGATHAQTPTAGTPAPTTAEVRTWAREAGLAVADRGRLHPDIWAAWHDAHTH